jgi:hypothetical protein
MFTTIRSAGKSQKTGLCTLVLCVLALASMTLAGCSGLVQSASSTKPGDTSPTPGITSLSPTSGAVGSSVTIAGANFGATQGTSTVTFNGTLATVVTNWSATGLVVTVPTGATTGDVVVTVGGVPSPGVNFTVTMPAPSITSLNPTSGVLGASVTVTGTNFGATQGTSTIKFNGIAATPTSWSATSIAVKVPAGATTGNVVVTVGGVASNGVSFTVTSPGPSITGLNPTSGLVGAPVTISGANFGATQGTSTVKFNGTAATATSWSATSVVVTVPTGATTGNVVVTVGGVASNGETFTITVPGPSISSLNPTSGLVGAAVTISGTNFGATQGTSTVKFNGTAATATSWSATSIVVTVPAGATTGNVVVTAGGVASNGVGFTVTVPAPSITSLNPTSGVLGASVTIAGTNFGATQGTSTVKFNGIAATPTSWSATSIAVTVPAGATTGSVIVTVGGVASNGVSFTVTSPGPSITSLNPTSGLVGATVTISGVNFGATQGTSTVKFNGTTATATSWSATSVVVTVPAGATSGNVVVTVGGVASNGVGFTVTVPTPSIASLNPTSGLVGATVTIAGTNFGATQGTSTVKFNGTAATVTSWSATSVVVTVPAGATTGNVVVTAGGVASNGVSFTVTTLAPSITSLNPTTGAVATPVTVAGTNFGATQGTSTVKFNGTAAAVTSWSATSILTQVPTGATTGNVVVTVAGVASNGVVFTLPTDTTPPSVPTGLTATAISASQINLLWTASTDNVGVTGYNIFRGGTKVGTAVSNAYSDASLAASTTYTYTVSAYDAAGNTSAQSSSASATTLAASTGGGAQYAMGWTILPNTNIQSYEPNFSTYPVSGNCGWNCVNVDWSSAWNDTTRNRMVMWGGGHQDYNGNELYTLDIAHGTMARATNPSYPYGSCTETNPDGTVNVRHTYDTMVYTGPTHDFYFQYGGALNTCGFSGVNFNTLQPNLTTWTSTAPTQGTNTFPQGFQGMCADYDPINDKVYVMDIGSFGYYDPSQGSAANSFTYLSTLTQVDYAQTCVVDRDNRLFIAFGDNHYYKFDLTQANPTQQVINSAPGCGNAFSSPFPLMAYYPYQHKTVMLGGSSSSTVYLFDPVAGSCTTTTVSGGPLVSDNSDQTMGSKLFGYYPSLGVFALGPVVQGQNSAILRLDAGAGDGVGGGSGSGLEYAFTNRAAGSLGSEGFDTNNFINSSSTLNNLGNCDNSLGGAGPTECFYDTSVSNSGAGSMRLDCPGLTSADCSGDWNFWIDPTNHTNYVNNSDIYFQFHVRGNTQLFTTDWESVVSSAPKHFILHQGSPSFQTCGNVEITEVQNGDGGANPFPSGYTECGATGFIDTTTLIPAGQCSNGNPCDEQGDTPTSGYWALYPEFQNAFVYSSYPNTWLVEYWHVHLGTEGSANSSVDAWIAPVGKPLKQFVKVRNFTFNVDSGCPGNAADGGECYYNMITFLLYMTNKNAAASHPTASMWIDELITSTSPIPAPYGPTPVPTP